MTKIYKEEIKEDKSEPKICGCGKTKDVNGYCDGSHQHTTKK